MREMDQVIIYRVCGFVAESVVRRGLHLCAMSRHAGCCCAPIRVRDFENNRHRRNESGGYVGLPRGPARTRSQALSSHRHKSSTPLSTARLRVVSPLDTFEIQKPRSQIHTQTDIQIHTQQTTYKTRGARPWRPPYVTLRPAHGSPAPPARCGGVPLVAHNLHHHHPIMS